MRDGAFGNPCNILFYVILFFFTTQSDRKIPPTLSVTAQVRPYFVPTRSLFTKPFIYAQIRQGIGVALCEYTRLHRDGALFATSDRVSAS